MFVLGFIVGVVVAVGAVWLLVKASSMLDETGLPLLLARRRIGEVEQATISRMLEEAEAANSLPEFKLDPVLGLVEIEDRRTP